jgi:hypothetical protein
LRREWVRRREIACLLEEKIDRQDGVEERSNDWFRDYRSKRRGEGGDRTDSRRNDHKPRKHKRSLRLLMFLKPLGDLPWVQPLTQNRKHYQALDGRQLHDIQSQQTASHKFLLV